MEIKQEKCDEIDIHNAEYTIKLEEGNSIEINCHGIKSEIDNQEITGSTRSTSEFLGTVGNNEESQSHIAEFKIKSEFPDGYTGQHTEELGTSDTSETSAHATVRSVWHRIKEDPNTEDWGEVKSEEQAEVEVKCEKPVSEIVSQQFEDMDSLKLNKLLDIETKVDPTPLFAELDRSCCKDDLIDHISISNCDNLNSNRSKPPGAASSCQMTSCAHCDQSFISKRTLGNHIIKKHPKFIASVPCKINACKSCDYKTTSKSSLDNHMSIHSDSTSGTELKTCTQCGKKFKRKWQLHSHIVRMHPDCISTVTSKIHGCPICVYKTMDKAQLQKHLSKHSREGSVVSSSETGLISDTSCELNIKTALSETVTLNDHIDQKQLDNSDAKFDIDTNSNEKDLISKKQTEYCKSESGTESNEKNTLDDLIAKKQSNTYQCTYCEFKTAKAQYLNRHVRKHLETLNNDPVPCVHCGQLFSSKTTLGGHIIREHPNFIASLPCKLHSCKSCDYKSSSKSSLDCHIVRKHPDYISSVTSKIHECSKCLYKTMRSREFQTHLLKHSRKGSSTLVPHRCTHCNVEAKGKRGLNCHISKKHPDFNATVTSKIHECSHCGFKTINS
nr:unnamed protein product [Callosobruchus chinensis]